MKLIQSIFLLLIVLIAASCSDQKKLVFENPIVKHQHRKGFHLDFKQRRIADAKRLNDQNDNYKFEEDDEVALLMEPPTQEIEEGRKEEFGFDSRSLQKSSKTNSAPKLLGKRKINHSDSQLSKSPFDADAQSESGITKEKDQLSQAGVLAIVFGVLSLVLFSVPILNIVLALFGMRFSKIAKNTGNPKDKEIGDAMMVLSIVGLAIGIIYTLFLLLYFAFIIFIVAATF